MKSKHPVSVVFILVCFHTMEMMCVGAELMKNQSFLLGFTNVVCFEGLLERTLSLQGVCCCW